MITINERIKAIRKAVGLTQAEFGARIGVKGNTITNYENDMRNPSEAIIFSICREFSVNETWLRTGEGEPFEKLSRDDELAVFLGKVSSGKNDFRRRFISALSVLSVDDWEVLEKIAAKLLEETKKADP